MFIYDKKMMGKFFIKTYGCQMNFHDSEKISGILTNNGYIKTNSISEADIIIINTCSVREKPQHKVYTELGRLKRIKKNKPNLIIVVAGCVAQQEGKKLLAKSIVPDIIIGPKNINELPVLLEDKEKLKNNKVVSLSQPKQEPCFNVAEIDRESNVKAFITVMEGCNKFCSYCIVPFTRGREIYRDFNSILKEISMLADKGYKEICLLGQNVNSYRYENYNFADLLEEISKIDEIKRIRFVTSYPKDFDQRIIRLMADKPKICHYLHLPVQSGSNKILEKMKRGYTVEEYLDLINSIKKYLPDIALSTDIIVGFPGESEDDFKQTLNLVSEVGFLTMYSFKYSPRPFTYALRYEDDVPPEVKQERLNILQSLQKDIQEKKYASFVNKIKEVLVEGYSKRSSSELTGRTIENIVVNFIGDERDIGNLRYVKISEAYSNSLKGEIVKITKNENEITVNAIKISS
jgi:tRNA-2-methylthio-N6-dimethylallyladenosine synthase